MRLYCLRNIHFVTNAGIDSGNIFRTDCGRNKLLKKKIRENGMVDFHIPMVIMALSMIILGP